MFEDLCKKSKFRELLLGANNNCMTTAVVPAQMDTQARLSVRYIINKSTNLSSQSEHFQSTHNISKGS